jgi:hypothetical protein
MDCGYLLDLDEPLVVGHIFDFFLNEGPSYL